MQAVLGTLQMAPHTLRSNRKNRNPNAAARGFHNLSREQWDALSDDERNHKKAEQKQYSDLLTRLALGGILSNIIVGGVGKGIGPTEDSRQAAGHRSEDRSLCRGARHHPGDISHG